MKIASVVSTKGGTGKTTTSANLVAFSADAGLRPLLIDLDPVQPSLSSYYSLLEGAQGGIYDLLAFNVTDCTRIVSSTAIPNLSLVVSNDINNQLINLLLQAPDGRLRLANLMPAFQDHFDLVLIDNPGCPLGHAGDGCPSLRRGHLPSPAEHAHRTRVRPRHHANARWATCLRPSRPQHSAGEHRGQLPRPDQRRPDDLQHGARDLPGRPGDFGAGQQHSCAVVFRNAASQGIPAHLLEYRQPSNRQSPSALSIIRRLAIEVFPEWRDRFESVTEERVAALVKGGR